MGSTPSRLANEAWESLMTSHAVVFKHFAASEIWQGLTTKEYDVLYTLSKCDEPIGQNELGRYVLLSQPALSRLVDRLVERGFISRRESPKDGRARLLCLTTEGKTIQRSIGGRHAVDVARTMRSALTIDEMTTLQAICTKLTQGVQND